MTIGEERLRSAYASTSVCPQKESWQELRQDRNDAGAMEECCLLACSLSLIS